MKDNNGIVVNEAQTDSGDDRGRDLKTHRIKPWARFLWVCFDLCLVTYTIVSTYEVWPHLLLMSILGGIAVLAASLYVTDHSFDKLDEVRSRATIGGFCLTLALVLNVLGHGGVSRSYSTQEELRAEQQENQDRANDARQQELGALNNIATQNANIAKANAEVDRNAATRTDSDRRFFNTTGRLRGSGSTAGAVKPVEVKGFKLTEAEEVTASPAEEAESWFWWVFAGFALELLTAVFVYFWVKAATNKDLNNNGILDSEETEETAPSAPVYHDRETPPVYAQERPAVPVGGTTAARVSPPRNGQAAFDSQRAGGTPEKKDSDAAKEVVSPSLPDYPHAGTRFAPGGTTAAVPPAVLPPTTARKTTAKDPKGTAGGTAQDDSKAVRLDDETWFIHNTRLPHIPGYRWKSNSNDRAQLHRESDGKYAVQMGAIEFRKSREMFEDDRFLWVRDLMTNKLAAKNEEVFENDAQTIPIIRRRAE